MESFSYQIAHSKLPLSFGSPEIALNSFLTNFIEYFLAKPFCSAQILEEFESQEKSAERPRMRAP